METIIKKYTKGCRIIGIGTGRTMLELSAFLPPSKVYIPTSTQSEIFLGSRGTRSIVSCDSLDIYIDSADYYNANNELIKGYGGALTKEKLFTKIAKRTVIVVDRDKFKESFDGLYVPVEILKDSLGYFKSILKNRKIKHIIKEVDGYLPFLTDNGNLIVEIEYNQQFLKECKSITGVVDHGFFEQSDNIYIEAI